MGAGSFGIPGPDRFLLGLPVKSGGGQGYPMTGIICMRAKCWYFRHENLPAPEQ